MGFLILYRSRFILVKCKGFFLNCRFYDLYIGKLKPHEDDLVTLAACLLYSTEEIDENNLQLFFPQWYEDLEN